MKSVTVRELRDHMRSVLDRVEAGAVLQVTVGGRPVAVLLGLKPARQRWVPKEAFLAAVASVRADPQLATELDDLLPETADDIDS